MAPQAAYRRVVVKISGEAFCAPKGFGIDAEALAAVVVEVRPLLEMKVQVALVVGGGNFLRGRELASVPSIQRTTADYMGMLATILNALALQDAMESKGFLTRVMGAIQMTQICEPFIRRRAVRHLEKGRTVIFAGGTGNPFFTTDMCAALRASEVSADVLLKATKVDGVFEADPDKQPGAKKFQRTTYAEVLARRLGVMDLSAVSLCMESRIPIVVFRLAGRGNLAAAARGEPVGTIIAAE